MAIKPDGQPAIAYLQSKAGSDETTLEVIAREGERWVPVGGIVDRAESLGDLLSPPRLAWESGGAWLAWTRGSQVQIARHTGQGWEQVAPALEARGGRIAFALAEGEPLIVAASDAAFATRGRRFHGGAWSATFDASPADASGLGTGPILATRGAAVYLAFPGLGNRCPLEQVRFAPEIP
jgi:hypothetical protein